ncbi:MAG: F0F1 ATP synthase subunit B' [Cyanobacteria bacterium]|uniref:F0F1 ATP synthase subunit B' n=1 Tax=Geminocystis sp. TaxID=2664100 RepID=UPI001D6A40C3|nr:F0F1 ATP synthase subunit B' [Cyanobacteria bacterium CG_2015-16_32_12]NCO79295.1 F0F1 ATP synthase subunit B' [Cyanobacteria bacterium CG_2015-22_32_23]NCQ05402.1 F0F1 ATP synthase subunit B' [Cyanobacteria bacterium CG_2015-09_32_10]NCQ41659.1 F0F1 ATP synthase subunit B' [Cyanobacteria bacterium CG_2015-04_32_10]NCS85608.1 F0F1 ATP synthase subunit B' [Cyanobacteria bacterium CG_2015-02_32_10]
MTQWILLAEQTSEGGLFDLDATLPLMAIQFLLLATILNILFYKPLGKAIDDRASYVQGQIAQAKKQKEEALALAQRYEQELKEVRKQSQGIISTAQSEAQKIVSDQIQQAQQEVIAERQKASEEIEAERVEALSALEQEVTALSRQILEKVIGLEFAQ